MTNKPIKVKQNWMVGRKRISLYELYITWGQSFEFRKRFGEVKPSQFEVKHVEAYLEAKANEKPPFNYSEKVVRFDDN